MIVKVFALSWNGADKKIRTSDPIIANAALSQLSYGPVWIDYVEAAITPLYVFERMKSEIVS